MCESSDSYCVSEIKVGDEQGFLSAFLKKDFKGAASRARAKERLTGKKKKEINGEMEKVKKEMRTDSDEEMEEGENVHPVEIDAVRQLVG